MVLPATEKACSQATLVACIAKWSLAINESIGNSLEWACHQRSGSTFSSYGRAKYRSISANSELELVEVCVAWIPKRRFFNWWK